MWTKFRHKLTFALLRPTLGLVMRILFGFKAKKCKLPKGPHLIISNHQATMDPFMLSKSFDRPIYFIASDDLFTKKPYSKAMRFLVAPIPKTKSTSDLGTIKICLKIIKEGGTIAVFPEGNRTFSGGLWHVDFAIVKLAKLLKVPLVYYTIRGGYGVEARWSNHIARGKMTGEVVKILSPEEIAQMDPQALYEDIIEKLDVRDAPSVTPFKSKRRAEKLERVLFLCPNCGSIQSIHSHTHEIFCDKCDMRAEYTENLTFKGNVRFETVYEWYQFQEAFIRDYTFEKDDAILFQDDDVQVDHVIRGLRRDKQILGTMTLSKNALIVKNDIKTITYPMEDITGMTALGKHKLDFYHEGRTLQAHGRADFNAIKYLQMYHKIKGEKI